MKLLFRTPTIAKCRSKLFLFLILILLCSVPLAAADVDIKLPELRLVGADALLPELIEKINEDMAAQLEGVLESDLANLITGYESAALTRGFTNTGIFTSHASTQFGRYNFDTFSLAIGTMAAFQVPSVDLGRLTNIIEEFDTNPDVLFGVGWQVWAAQFGLNLGVFDPSLDRFNVKLQFGYLPLQFPLNERATFSFTSWNIGALVDYALVEELSGLIIGWQGLTISSGFIAAGKRYRVDYSAAWDKSSLRISFR